MPFESGVQCESCHGPGREHIELKGSKAVIQNPKRFTSVAINEFCGACHRKHSADQFTNWNEPWNARHQPLSFAQSRCFKESEGKLSCFTCHAPHSSVDRSSDGYGQQCRSCHEAVRHKIGIARESCVGCHMPAVKLENNLRFANHWIGVYAPGTSLIPR